MRELVCAISLAAMLTASPAFAQETPEDGLYMRLAVGANFVGDWSQDITYNPNSLLLSPPLASGQTVENGAGWVAGGALGFDYADGIRTELEYRYAKSPIDAVTPVGGAAFAAPGEEDIRGHFVFGNFFYDFHNASAFTPFIGLGVGGAFVANEYGQHDAALAYQGRAGIAWNFDNGASVDIEYVYLRTNDLVYGPRDDQFASGGPALRIDGDGYQSSSVMLGFRKKF